jgi:hypothetical protein
MTLENLNGHSVYIVESEDLAESIGQRLSMLSEIATFETTDEVPENLLETMNDNDIELAIIHLNSTYDFLPILEAHEAGKIIVVLARDPLTINDQKIIGYLRDAQIPYEIKAGSHYVTRAYHKLASLIEKRI